MTMLIALGLCAAGLAVLIGGAELVVRGGVHVAARLGVSPLIIGLTVVAIGTSAPELAVGVEAVLGGNGELAVANIAGTNTVNILLILGLSALLSPLALRSQTVRFDLPAIVLSAIALMAMALDGVLTRGEGVAMVLAGAVYTAGIVQISRRERRAVAAEYAQAFGDAPQPRDAMRTVLHVAALLGGVAIVVIGAGWLVDGAVRLARLWNVSEAFIGLTIVAIGTSSPELVTTLVCTVRGNRDIATGNLVGSSVYNILIILGVTCLVPAGGVPVSADLVHIDIPVMTGVALLCLPVFATGRRVSRFEGGVFVVLYLAYLTYLIAART